MAEIDWWARITNVLIGVGTLALAVIGTIAACIAIRTLKAIEKQAGLQKIAMRQWITTGEWTQWYDLVNGKLGGMILRINLERN